MHILSEQERKTILKTIKKDSKIVIVPLEYKYLSHNWNNDGEMDKYCGTVMTVRHIVISDDFISTTEDDGEWMWDSNMIDWDKTFNLFHSAEKSDKIKSLLID